MRKYSVILVLLVCVGLVSCEFMKKAYKTSSDAVSNVNVFPYTQDIELGKQVQQEIAANPQEFPVLKKAGNAKIYSYMVELKQTIINSGQLKYGSEFAWDITIIDDDETLNAFATPGGYIYIYTGLIKFLDSEDELIGVLGHEMAHSDRRHSTRQLTKSLGLSILLDAVLGQQDAVEQILGQLAGLKFSRTHESEADEYSVRYLCGTSYNSDGAAGFFVKLANQPTPPAFLSTHPSPENRIEEMATMETSLNCTGNQKNTSRYNQMKALLN